MLSVLKLRGVAVCAVGPTRLSLSFSRPLVRHYASSIVDSVSPERRQEIAAAIREYEKDGVAVPWFSLIKQHRISQDAMEHILAADDSRLQQRKELSARVTRMADSTFDERRGRCYWESVARDMDMPLVECLRLYNTSLSTVSPWLFPKYTDWPPEELSELKALVAEHFDAITADDWPLVGVYMNIRQADCFMVYNLYIHPRMTPDIFEKVTKLRNGGLTWKAIHERIPIFACGISLNNAYHCFKNKPSDDTRSPRTRTKWSDADIARIKDLVREYYRPGDRRKLLEILRHEFPDKSQAVLDGQISRFTSKSAKIINDDMDCVSKLVGVYGEDWQRIAREIDTTPKRAERIWKMHQQRLKATSAWTDSELDTLRNCMRDGIGPAEASRLIGTKMVDTCKYKMRLLKRDAATGGLQKHQSHWNSDDVTRLTHLVSTYRTGVIDWAAISKDLGRSVNSCQLKHNELQRERYKQSTGYVEAVSHEVQLQYEHYQRVDWAAVAKAVGRSERECLEASQFSTDKARWIYDPDTFSWETADRMTLFIEQNYPKPLPVNYTAVSNFMWIDINDCIKMASLLRGEMEWTDEVISKIAELRKQGMTYKNIAKQLSPNLTIGKVANAYLNHVNPRVYTPLSAEEKQHVRYLVAENAEQMPFAELRALIRRKMSHFSISSWSSFIESYAAAHPAYKKRLEDSGIDKVASQITNGDKPSELAAQLGIPSRMLTNLMQLKASSIHSSTWTPEETEKLLEYVRSNQPPYNWKPLSDPICLAPKARNSVVKNLRKYENPSKTVNNIL